MHDARRINLVEQRESASLGAHVHTHNYAVPFSSDAAPNNHVLTSILLSIDHQTHEALLAVYSV